MNEPLTEQKLSEFFPVYREAFPDWTVENRIVLTRIHSLLKQSISFQALRSGAYRPSCAITLLLQIPDGCRILDFQRLDIKHREVYPREHLTKWPLVIKAMEEQFVPSIREPLDVDVVVRLAEEYVAVQAAESVNMNYSTGLAVLHAFQGNSERAAFWCGQVIKRYKTLGRKPADWETRKAQYADDLRHAIADGEVHQFLMV